MSEAQAMAASQKFQSILRQVNIGTGEFSQFPLSPTNGSPQTEPLVLRSNEMTSKIAPIQQK